MDVGFESDLPQPEGAARTGLRQRGLRVDRWQRLRTENAQFSAEIFRRRRGDPGGVQLHAGAPLPLSRGRAARRPLDGDSQQRWEGLRRHGFRKSGMDRSPNGTDARPPRLAKSDRTASRRGVPEEHLEWAWRATLTAPHVLSIRGGTTLHGTVHLYPRTLLSASPRKRVARVRRVAGLRTPLSRLEPES